MAITAAQVNELRKKTGAGMMDCKNALNEANGDFDKAIEILRKKGAAVAAKRAERSANEGLILTKVSPDNKFAVMVEINCETDFVANSEDFINFSKFALDQTYQLKSASFNELMEKNPAVKEKLNDLIGKIGEKIEISRIAIEEAPTGAIVDYVHFGSKLGVLVKLENVPEVKDDLITIAKDIAMQVAAMKPMTVYREDVSKDVIEKEMDIYKELARKEGKPEQMLEKIALGRMNKFYQENCLVEQFFVKDNSKIVGDLIKNYNSNNNSNIKIGLFRRFHLSDEKK